MSGPSIYRLSNRIQHYDWGSEGEISDLLGTTSGKEPEAELWMGAHPSAPSLATPWEMPDAAAIPLNMLIQQQPAAMLGARVLDEFGPKLPYLLKVLAASQALSLQVHPPAHKARAGFNKENREKIPLDAPYRNFKDENHKPEMVVAVTEFHALAGLRAPRVVLRMLEGLAGELFDNLRGAIIGQAGPAGLKTALTNLLALPKPTPGLAQAIAAVEARVAAGSQYEVADQTVIELAAQYPGDVGALASYLLNRVTLHPGEALFLDDGEPHAYLKGLGIEAMANSDNVLRAGLTHKHVDVPILLECMSFTPRMPFRPDQVEAGVVSRAVTYRPPTNEFAVTMFDLQGGLNGVGLDGGSDGADPEGAALPIHPSGPRILLMLDGEATLTFANPDVDADAVAAGGGDGDGATVSLRASITLPRGTSIFLPDAAGPAALTGNGQAALAFVP